MQRQIFGKLILVCLCNCSLNYNQLFVYNLCFLQAKYNAVFDQLDLVTYEEVVKLPAYRRKTLVRVWVEFKLSLSRVVVDFG